MDKKETNEYFTTVRKQTDNPFLNLYEMDALAKSGRKFQYYFASRNEEKELPLLTKEMISSGVVIYPLWKEDPNKIVLIKQYRYPVGIWIYELPAGLIDKGETAREAAIREMQEETGLDFIPYEGGNEAFRRATFISAGMSDETSCAVFGFASGNMGDKLREDSERIEVILADKQEVKRILAEENTSLRANLLLMQFLQAEGFEFLEI